MSVDGDNVGTGDNVDIKDESTTKNEWIFFLSWIKKNYYFKKFSCYAIFNICVILRMINFLFYEIVKEEWLIYHFTQKNNLIENIVNIKHIFLFIIH